MGKGLRIRAGELKGAGTIRPGTLPATQVNISFSFRYLDKRHSKFDYAGRESAYFCKVIERISSICDMTLSEVLTNRSSSMRAHPIDWSKTSEPDGFSSLNQQLRESTPYQFSISSNEHGRVHGFFLGNVFHVVWLDHKHRLYP